MAKDQSGKNKGKKYPWYRRVFGKIYAGPEPLEAVYAGPEPDDPEEDPAQFEEVYAGPGFYENRDSGEEIIDLLYAGPEFIREKEDLPEPPGETPEEAPENKPEEAQENEPEDPEKDPPEEEKARNGTSDEKTVEVNLPPKPPRRTVDPRQFMCVYAGPEYFAARSDRPVGAFGFAPPAEEKKKEEPKDGAYYCPFCGMPIAAESKFCPECGAVQPKTEKKE